MSTYESIAGWVFIIVLVALCIWKLPRIIRSLNQPPNQLAESQETKTPIEESTSQVILDDPHFQELQDKIDRLLKWGILFSVFWLAGFGSLIAFVNGMKARRLIKNNDYPLKGMGRVKWCLIVGLLGMLIWFPIMLGGIIANLLEAAT